MGTKAGTKMGKQAAGDRPRDVIMAQYASIDAKTGYVKITMNRGKVTLTRGAFARMAYDGKIHFPASQKCFLGEVVKCGREWDSTQWEALEALSLCPSSYHELRDAHWHGYRNWMIGQLDREWLRKGGPCLPSLQAFGDDYESENEYYESVA